MSAQSWTAATHAAGAALHAVESALDGVPAFAAVRPPGHHALARTAMGFCLLNNVVIAAYAAIADHGVDRVLIVDWDVHHGNGTQDLVHDDQRIRYVSLHQWPLYPGTGRAEERGVGNIFNVPRPPGLPRATYVRDLSEAVERATEGWTPQLVLISAGYDALMGDPLAGFTLEPEDYAAWIRTFRTMGAPMAAVLEGGYVPRRVAEATAVTVRELADTGSD
jgi:acetoin utilization deacetylase AcuC-like enzyme